MICTNPPYVRNHHIPPQVKRLLQSRVAKELGITVSGLSGLYVYFMLLADRVLAKGGVAAWLIPSEFLSVNYGKAMREYLSRKVSLITIEKYETADVQFSDALVSSCIVTYRKSPPARDGSFTWTVVRGKFRHKVTVPYSRLSSDGKWNFGSAFAAPTRRNASNTPRTISDYFNVKRGIATGGNSFFVLTNKQVDDYAIPSEFLKPVLPSPRFLTSNEIRSTSYGKDNSDHFLLDCPLPPEEVKEKFPSLSSLTWDEAERASLPRCTFSLTLLMESPPMAF